MGRLVGTDRKAMVTLWGPENNPRMHNTLSLEVDGLQHQVPL